MAPLRRDSEQEMDTRRSPVGVEKADMLVQLCFHVCSSGLAGGSVQTLCITFAEVIYDERNAEPTASRLSTQVITVTLSDKQEQV